MDVSGVELIPAPQQAVWDALNDPDVLKACIAGCEVVEKTSETEFGLVMNAAVGPVKARFTGKLAITESDPPNRYVLTFEGAGGAAGFGKGSASVSLVPTAAGTELKYVATAQVGGKIAQVGSRLIDGVAKKMAEDFFGRLICSLSCPGNARCEDSHRSRESWSDGGRAGVSVANRTWIWIAGCVVALLVLGTMLLAR